MIENTVQKEILNCFRTFSRTSIVNLRLVREPLFLTITAYQLENYEVRNIKVHSDVDLLLLTVTS